MLLASLFLCGSALLGFAIVNLCLRRHLSFEEKLLWGVVVGWSISTTAVYFVARWKSKLSSGSVTWATVLICLSALLFLVPSIRRLVHERPTLKWKPQLTALLLVLALFTPIYWQLFSSHLFALGPGGIYSGGSASADLNFHAAISSSFFYGDNFPPSYTPSVGRPLLYPFLPDFQTSVLMSAGLSMRAALLITSLALTLVTTGLFFYFALRIAKKPIAGIIATILFLLNGGLGFIDLIRDWLGSGKSFLQFWNSMEVNYANYAEHGLHWPNIITDVFVPQRTVLFGLPIGLIVLTFFAADFDSTLAKEKNTQRAGMYLFAGALTGLLPLFHVHTYISLGLISGFLFVLKPHRLWILFWLPAILLASPHLASLVTHASGGGFVRLQPGWMGHDEPFFPLYLVRNLGLPLLLAIPAWFALDREWRKFYVAFVLLLAISLTVVVSPNLFDNGKLIYYWHAVNSVIIANWLVRLAFTHRQAVLATILALLCIATGLTALQSEKLQHALVFNDEDIAAAKFAIEHTSPQSLFLTAPITNQPILSLAGRFVLRGPTSWLWGHGYEFRDREADVRRIYAGAEDALDLLAYYGVDYVFVGDTEKSQLRAKTEFFDANFPVAYRSATIRIYDTRLPLMALKAEVPKLRSYERLVSYDPYALLADFPETSFFVYRSWIVANARMPKLDEFKRSMSVLMRELSQGSASREQLEVNRRHLINELLETPESRTRLSDVSNSQYVNTLLTNAGLREDHELGRQLSSELDQQTETRSTVVRKIVDDKRLYRREYNSAFVLVHYFGYLDRNPTDLPDTNLEGFNYWRRILDSSRDYRSISRAFLESEEYRKREIRAVP
jgi:hypothetical protein